MTKKKIFLTFALLLCGALHAQTVYVSKTGHKYHATPTCWALSRSKNPQAINIEDAKQRGLDRDAVQMQIVLSSPMAIPIGECTKVSQCWVRE